MKLGNRFKDLSGSVFTRLTVLSIHGLDKHGRYLWRCVCECGEDVVVASGQLIQGKTKSCGCIAIKGRLVYGHGLAEKGKYPFSLHGKPSREFRLWKGMLKRCYDNRYHEDYPTYKDCLASSNFKNFQYFADWCQSQKGFSCEGWQLDKDILVKGNKIYSEDNCVFVPISLNSSFTCKDIKGYYALPNGKYTSNYGGRHLGTFQTKECAVFAHNLAKMLFLKNLLDINREHLDSRVVKLLEEMQ